MSRYLQQSVIKSIQRFDAEVATDSIFTYVTISSVNTAKSIVIFQGVSTVGTSLGIEHLTKVMLYSATSVRFSRQYYTANPAHVTCEVVEFY